MTKDEYLERMADLDLQYRSASLVGDGKKMRQIDKNRKSLSRIYEAESRRPNPIPKSRKIETLNARQALKELRVSCMKEAVRIKKAADIGDDYAQGVHAGKLEAFDQVYDMIAVLARRV